MKTIKITISNLIATAEPNSSIIKDNTGYQIQFDFDADWNAYPMKTAVFTWTKRHKNIAQFVPFEGNAVPIPRIPSGGTLLVGVTAGDIQTTTPAVIRCRNSILSGDFQDAESLSADTQARFADLLRSGLERKLDRTGHTPNMYLATDGQGKIIFTEQAGSNISGSAGASAYEIAQKHGFSGTEEEWLASLKGANGKTAYQYAVDKGYSGTETEFSIRLAQEIPSVTQQAGESESLVMSQKAVTDLVADAIGNSGTSNYETVDSPEEMTDTSKSYVLSSTGTIWTYGEVTTETEPTNKLVPEDATLNARLSGSSGSVSSNTSSVGSFVTDFIAVDEMENITPFTVRLNWELIASGDNKILYFDSGKNRLGSGVYNGTATKYTIANGETIFDAKDTNADTSTMNWADVAYIRLQLFVKSVGTTLTVTDIADLTITFDHEGGTKTENIWYDTGLAPSTGSGNSGSNYVALFTKVSENKSAITELNTRLTTVETSNGIATVPSFWQNAVDICISKIKALQVGKHCVTFPFFSDNHQRNGYAGVLIALIMKECHIPYCFYGGDSISSDTIADEADMIAQDKAFDAGMSYIPNGRFCRAVGNHDGYWYDGTNKFYYDRNQIYDLFLREESVAQNKRFGDDGTYYYVDEQASKVRFIVLNTNGGSVDDVQLEWFRDTALNVNTGWAVVVISHQPISNHYHANISNASDVRSVAAASGTEIIGWFSGHIHRDRIYTGAAINTTDDSQGDNMGFTQVTITSDNTAIAYEDTTKHTVANDDQSHAIDFVTINRNARTVHLTRLGIGDDRNFSY